MGVAGWQHFKGPIESSVTDGLLLASSPYISFVFSRREEPAELKNQV